MFEEPISTSWALRFGMSPPEGVPEAAAPFLAHRSVRRFRDEPVPEPMVAALVAAAQSAATSSNLQLWSVISVQDPDRRERMAQLCADQKQIRTCAWFFAFLADHHRLRQAAAQVGQATPGLGYAEFFTMAIVDASLAAERMVCAAEALGLGICYIGALRNDPAGVAELLALPEGTFGVFGLCVGWPTENAGADIKPRLSPHAVWFREQYHLSPDTQEYDERMSAFYEAQRMKDTSPWSLRSGVRADGEHMTGREGQKAWLESQGFLRK